MKAAIYTLGCKVNQFESAAIGRELEKHGFTLVDFQNRADLYIVNTCTVTAVGDKKSRQMVRQARRLSPDAVVAVCGCFAQVSPEDAQKLDADIVYGTGNRMEFAALAERTVRERRRSFHVARPEKTFELLRAGSALGRTRALLKIQDGCVNFCAYCIIPYARGPVRSMPLETVRSEAARLNAEGFREIVLTGIEISSYGQDLPGKPPLAEAVATVCAAAPGARVRLGSLEPRTIDRAFCDSLRGYENLCPHFHLSLQSGCDATLARMGRRYDTARYLQSVRQLKDVFPGCAVTTDLIVGFPGETEEEFAQTLSFIRRCAFASMHIFPYSKRSGTRAAAMPEQVARAEKASRAKIAAEAAREMSLAFRTGLIGTAQQVLFETEKDGFSLGHAENYIEVRVQKTGLHGEVHPVKVTGVTEDGVSGEIC